ncbi:MAG: hypothetical protein SVM80_08655 [Halobacteriota archaeon]|nr:hypothetical protein [Halobacteriota archaeon]
MTEINFIILLSADSMQWKYQEKELRKRLVYVEFACLCVQKEKGKLSEDTGFNNEYAALPKLPVQLRIVANFARQVKINEQDKNTKIKMEELCMKSFNEYINEYRKQIDKGDIVEAYKGLMDYIMNLRMHFKNKHPDYFVSGSIYYGYMDMTYFSFTPESLKSRKLKIAIVFIHEKIRFEVWLAGHNKQIQAKYWKLFKESDWSKYRIPSTTKGVDSIIEHTLVDNPDFNDLDTLTEQIEIGALKFIKDVETFLSKI